MLVGTLLFAANHIVAQEERQPHLITGRVVDGETNQGVSFANIAIKERGTHSVKGGTSSDDNGYFELKSDTSGIYLEISFVGYEPKIIVPGSLNTLKIGDIRLNPASNLLQTVVIEDERSSMEFKLDKRVYNVGKDLSTSGAGINEVLNKVPSVNVNIEGEVSLRGNKGVQILINGKPSVLANEGTNALGTITADMIDRIEVITNPSAKYEAEGTAGIINIVLKKEEKKGLNGSVSINTGVPHNHSAGISINNRSDHLNLFAQAGAGYRSLPRYTQSLNIDKMSSSMVLSDGVEYRNEQFYNIILGSDIYFNDRNILTISGNAALELESQPSETAISIHDLEASSLTQWTRSENTDAINPKYQYEAVYKSQFIGHEDHVLLLTALGSHFGKVQESQFSNLNAANESVFPDQQTETSFDETNYTFSADYTNPINDKFKIEAGSRYVIQDVGNAFTVRNNINGEWITDPGYTNDFTYSQNVLGVYTTAAYEGDTFGIKLGLRVENTDLLTELVNTGQSNHRNFTNLFPSAHVSYKISPTHSVQAGYSRRIYRPRLWDLNPFFNIRNNFNIRSGNPDLLPEFSDSYELQSIHIRDKSSVNLGLFYLKTTNVIERVSMVNNGVNTTMPLNLGVKHAIGFDGNAKLDLSKALSLTANVNANQFQRIASYEGQSVNFSAFRWNTKLTSRMKIKYDIEIELTGQYESAYKTVQGSASDQVYLDAGIRKKLFKRKGVINLSIRDMFASRISEVVADQPNFFTYNKDWRGRFITFGFSYGFGKGEAMEYTGRRH
ncbi:MAG: outer membrane beta-barrel family protein [Salibacteraceae bacterium]